MSYRLLRMIKYSSNRTALTSIQFLYSNGVESPRLVFQRTNDKVKEIYKLLAKDNPNHLIGPK